MAWNDKAPTEKELKATKPSWDEIPPSREELGKGPEMSELESALRGGAQGLTLGFAPAIAGAAEAVPTALNAITGQSSLQDLMAKYQAAREASLSKFKEAEETNPKSYLAGQVGGGLLSAPLLPEATGALGAAKLGAGLGALGGLGQSVSAGDDLSNTAKNAALQGLAGGAIGGVVGKVASAFSPENLDQIASQRAVKATGANKAQLKRLQDSNRLEQHGQNLLDSKVVTPLATPEDILERTKQLAETSGKQIGDILNKLDESAMPEARAEFFNPKTAADQIEALQQQFTKNGEVVPLYKSEYNKLQDALDTLGQFGDEPVSFNEANQLKQLISNTAYNDEGKLQDQLMGQVRGIVNDGIENAADKVTQKSGDPELFQQYMKSKDLYRTAKDAQVASSGKSAGNLTNRDLGITDYMAGLGGLAAHGGPGAIAAAGINKVAKTYGNSIAATSANTVSDAFSAMGSALSKANPIDLKSMGKRLIGTGDELTSKLGNILVQASDKDTIGRNALIFSLLQNPSYRDKMHSILKDNK